MTCSWCAGDLHPLSRTDSRFCATRCRVAAHRAQPAKQLRDVDRWVRRSVAKVPLTADGCAASSTDPATWCDFATASTSKAGAGLGFVLSNADRIVCIDLDHCLDGKGSALPWATDLLADLPSTYIEVSPSGDGLHVWGFADVTKGRRTDGVEVYGTGRYITVTARRWHHSTTTFADLGIWISRLPL